MRTALYLLVASALVAGCWDDSRPIAWTRDRTVLGPIPLKAQVAYVDSALDRVTLVELGADTPTIATKQIGRNAVVAMPSPDRHFLFVITRGEEAIHEGEIDQPPMFWVIDTQHLDAEAIAYQIGSPFDQVAVSPDDSVAIAYFSASGPDNAGFFRNPNELAIIHLDAPPDDAGTNPTLKTIRAFGAVPDGITMSPAMVVPGAPDTSARTFAFVLSTDNLTVLDTANPSRREVSIRLDLGGTSVEPKQVVYAPDTASAYVRSDGASDVLQVSLQPITPATADGADYLPLLAELGAGGGPTDIAVYDNAAGRRTVLASTPNTGSIVVIDADTAQFRTVPLEDPIDRIVLFPTDTDNTAGPPTKALFASISARLPRLEVLDLGDVADPLVQPTARTITLEQPVLDVVPVPDRDLAMIVHDDARTVLGMLDMDVESTAPLLGVGKLDSYDFTPSGTYLMGATQNVSRIGFVSLDDLHPTDFRLDDPPAKVLSTANAKIFVDHGDPFGHATIIPSPTSARADAIVLRNFLIDNLLDEEP